jgi:hypothetical protein
MGLATPGDPKVMRIELNDPGSRAKEIHEQSKEGALLQSSQ